MVIACVSCVWYAYIHIVCVLAVAGWAGGCCSGEGHRISLQHTRAIIDAIHGGQLQQVDYVDTPHFHLQVRQTLSGHGMIGQQQQHKDPQSSFQCLGIRAIDSISSEDMPATFKAS